MAFVRGTTKLFTVSVSDSNATIVNRCTLPALEHAQPASTCALDLELWHWRFGHVNVDYVRRMLKEDSVSSLKLNSDTAPDAIYEPCILGKLHWPPVPLRASWWASEALDLIHMDVHGPIPVQSNCGRRRLKEHNDSLLVPGRM
ncbi:hypothetical protein PUNSTDRAFT_138115 [Punctularia strigosozonata HHB-11173 SS5]|uniref:GAG-pre-integrase domain-containing protein n=1 Tax=Punctularia strigosozonata (strain HHB-11173) TaxID=741275 RepID=R7S5R5_PUNST|nr:uncharacterized protein PUNSTDRAFT_138115 [Punctularia strigosozonata HHB-11173 SS5]EIN04926.1 hypothetical protein PUNSTDRAFT_138115 [Punctularia strigosozonata HHB-11173 SS5]